MALQIQMLQQMNLDLMPYLSEDGSKNVYILSVGRYYGLNKKLEDDSQKLEDTLKVMEVLSTVEGTASLYSAASLKSQSPSI